MTTSVMQLDAFKYNSLRTPSSSYILFASTSEHTVPETSPSPYLKAVQLDGPHVVVVRYAHVLWIANGVDVLAWVGVIARQQLPLIST